MGSEAIGIALDLDDDGMVQETIEEGGCDDVVASMGGNAGTQTLTVAVRALAMKDLTEANTRRFVGKELLIGVANGLLFAALAGLVRSFMASARFPWLVVNLMTAIVASIVIGLFEATIEQIVALAVLMPIVASMGGNAGTQTLTIAVMRLTTSQGKRARAARCA